MVSTSKPTCFIAMPITTRKAEEDEFGDPNHWLHVMEALFIKAIREAGYEEIVPQARGAWLIHDRIVTNLVEADMVLCDMSSLNSNVFFELGVRTSLNKPIALVYDGRSPLSFDTSGINTYKYKVPLEYWSMDEHVAELAQHIKDSAESCAGENPLWRQFGLKIAAQQPSTSDTPLEAKVDLLLDRIPVIQELQFQNEALANELNHRRLESTQGDSWPASQSKAGGNVGIAAEAMSRYASREGLSFLVEPGLGGHVIVFHEGELHQVHRQRILDLARRYGVSVHITALTADGLIRGVDTYDDQRPTPEQFMQRRDPEDDDGS